MRSIIANLKEELTKTKRLAKEKEEQIGYHHDQIGLLAKECVEYERRVKDLLRALELIQQEENNDPERIERSA